MTRQKEPRRLLRGKSFHKKVQADWEQTAEGEVRSEKGILKPSGRRGRVDVFVTDDDPDSPAAVVEIKASDWDRMTEEALRRNVRRQIKQVWDYIESQVRDGKHVRGGEGKDVCPGIVFPRRPKEKERLEMIENLFNEEGIAVVWEDESITECSNRNASG